MSDADRESLAALILGVAGLSVLPLLASVPAVYLGRRAQRTSRETGASIRVARIATALGWLGIVLGTLAVIVALTIVGGDV